MEENSADASFDWGKFGIVLFIILLVAGVFVYVFSDNTKPVSDSNEVTSSASNTNELSDGQIGGVDEMDINQDDVTELVIKDIKVGTGDEAVSGKSVTVHYTGTLTDGTKFDSSLDLGVPFTFDLGAGRVIQGWDQGVVGMKVGGVRRLTIPADLGYGDRGAPPDIPPGATLVFQIELLEVE